MTVQTFRSYDIDTSLGAGDYIGAQSCEIRFRDLNETRSFKKNSTSGDADVEDLNLGSPFVGGNLPGSPLVQYTCDLRDVQASFRSSGILNELGLQFDLSGECQSWPADSWGYPT